VAMDGEHLNTDVVARYLGGRGEEDARTWSMYGDGDISCAGTRLLASWRAACMRCHLGQ